MGVLGRCLISDVLLGLVGDRPEALKLKRVKESDTQLVS